MGLFLLNGQVERYGGAMKELVQRKVDAHPSLWPGGRTGGCYRGDRYAAGTRAPANSFNKILR